MKNKKVISLEARFGPSVLWLCLCVYTGLSVRSSVWHCAIWLLAPVQSAPIPLRKLPLLNIHNHFLSILFEARLLK